MADRSAFRWGVAQEDREVRATLHRASS
jgi:hypothetical protein